jgi:hypothetical protein
MKTLALFLAPLLLLAQPRAAAPARSTPAVPVLTAAEKGLMAGVSAAALRAHVSFLASDALEGRDTPSKGLEAAAEYIGAHFRRLGLEPVSDGGYFQTAPYVLVRPNAEGFEMTLETGGQKYAVSKGGAQIEASKALEVNSAGIVRVGLGEPDAPLDGAALKGKVVLVSMPNFMSLSAADREKVLPALMRDRDSLAASGAALVVVLGGMGRGGSGPRLREASVSLPPQVTVTDQEFIKIARDLKPGPVSGRLTAKLPAQPEEKVALRNIVGVLRGSDPVLMDTYILVTAHYDHVGVRGQGAGDNVYNGANDDASGTAAVLDLAEAFARSGARPKRSLVFMAYFGEEKGLLGSRYYGRNPIFPLAKTVANLNLEQVGRTDDTEGPQYDRATLTGFDYSDVGAILAQQGERIGITFWKHEQKSDSFFGRSDNQALADLGVPAHTLCTAFEYPDYHRAGDHWDKIDYANMERVTRAVALGLYSMANRDQSPAWNPAQPKAKRYLEAGRKLR